MTAGPIAVGCGEGKAIRILGTRGIPARHGGFETFAEVLASHLAQRGWRVTVYCQETGKGAVWESVWSGVELVHTPAPAGVLGTVVFDWKTVRHASTRGELVLTLGYNTGILNALHRWRGVTNLMNMDGLEWRRAKWSLPARLWLRLNEWLGSLLASHLVADHPEIARYLARRVRAEKITMIPYGADVVRAGNAATLARWDLKPREYALVIARIEPENSILEIVEAFSRRRRNRPLVLLGQLAPDRWAYHRAVRAAAGDEVVFLGAIYERAIVNDLRFHARLYVHGHSVGGTNPSLVEAIGAGSPVLAHDNVFNRWVAGAGAAFFGDTDACTRAFDDLLDDEARLETMRQASYLRHSERFTWERILGEYETLLGQWADSSERRVAHER